MKTIVTLEITHDKPLPEIAQMLAGRAWTIAGVKHAEVISDNCDLRAVGFTEQEIALGATDVVRS